ncbi:hypothetical protein L0Y34_01880 [Candidatus Parcubacteria bacterium]|nr:hypothetical protein [Candidatus Parcubacteria bacterium]
MFDLSKKEEALFKKLSSPIKIQDFLDKLPFNYETKGETYMSPRRVLAARTCHCFEGALLAAAILSYHGEKPLIMNLRTIPADDDHALALYKRNGLWGAISKTNHAVLRFRDPIYTTPRELAASYFHEYFFNDTGLKTLRAYSAPMTLSRFGTPWVTSEKSLVPIAHKLRDTTHTALFPDNNRSFIRHASIVERRAGRLTEWSRNGRKT